MEAAEFVQTFPLLRLAVSDAEPLMEHLSEVSVASGAPVIRYGEENASIFFITEGRLDLALGGGTTALPVGQVGRGQWVGELGLLSPGMAIADVRAVEPSRLHSLSNWQLQALVRSRPKSASALLHAISLQLSERLRMAGSADAVVPESREGRLRNLGHRLMIGESR